MPRQSTNILGSCIRSQETTLPTFLGDIERMHALFGSDIGVALFENDSKDKTRLMLQEWTKTTRVKDVSLVLKHNLTGRRTHRLAFCRNALWRIAVSKKTCIRFISVDSDYKTEITNLPLFVHSILSCNETACFSNSFPFLYDYWALRHSRYENSDIFRDGFLLHFSSFPMRIRQETEVNSSYNGAAVYRMDKMTRQAKKCSYAGSYRDGYLVCEHVPFHLCLKDSIPAAKFVVLPFWESCIPGGGIFSTPGLQWILLICVLFLLIAKEKYKSKHVTSFARLVA